jgi:ceramide synthetase
MSSILSSLSSLFWTPDIWLPPGLTWDTLQQPHQVNNTTIYPDMFAQFGDLCYPLPLALLMLLARGLVERGIFKHIGIKLGLKDNKRAYPTKNTILEKAFKINPSLHGEDLTLISQDTGLSSLQVERWFRQRKQAELPNTLQKFSETGWRWVFYSFILVYGFICLWDKAWLWDIRFCWYSYPFHQMDNDVWWYYMLELSFYWSLSFSQFFDVRRKDFWEMFIHHNTTICLIMFSWTAHFTRIGTLVMILHDCADPLLELAKLFRYAGYRKTCDAVFVLFSLVWVMTRCLLYPTWILYSTLYDAAGFIEFFAAYYIFNSLLVTLQLLHILWTYFLFKAIHKALTKGGVDDQRSDSEPSEDENENELKKEN